MSKVKYFEKLKIINSYFLKQESLFKELLYESNTPKRKKIIKDLYSNLIREKGENFEDLKRFEKSLEKEKELKDVWIVLDSETEDFNIKARDYFKERYPQLSYMEGKDIIKDTSRRAKVLWYFMTPPSPRISVFITKKDLINKIIKDNRVERVVILVARNSLYHTQKIINPIFIDGIKLGGKDFVFHFAFYNKIFHEDLNKFVMAEFKKYLSKIF